MQSKQSCPLAGGELMCLCRFSHPVAALNETFLSINNGLGTVEGITPAGPNGKLCGSFQVPCNHGVCAMLWSKEMQCVVWKRRA